MDIEVKEFGAVFVACDGEKTCIGHTEEEARQGLLDMINDSIVAQEYHNKKAAPIENAKGLRWFDGTSWGTK